MASEKDSKTVFQQKFWGAGITNIIKEPSSQNPNEALAYWYSQCIDTRTDPYALTLLPATQKESGGTVTDLVKWADLTPASLITYLYGDSGNIYSRTSAGSWSLLHQTASSHGNGLQYFFGDDYLYYTGDMALGRYGPLSSSPTFSDDFLTAQGGVPQNTYSLALVSASSQSADAADSISLSVTGDLTLEAYFYLNTFPAVGSSMTLIGKWDESGTLRSYIMDIYGISGFFGDGSSGALTISVDTTQSLTDSVCTGTTGSVSLSATNASFAIGQQILIHQTQGTSVGQWERNVISGYTAGTITLQSPLSGTYTTGAQVIVIPQYSNITINSGKTWTAKSWNGTVGGILVFLASGTLSGAGNISATGSGFGGGATSVGGGSWSGEGTTGPSNHSPTVFGAAVGNGAGTAGNSGGYNAALGAGGITGGGVGAGGNSGGTVSPGITSGTTDLTNMVLGGGGSSGENSNSASGGTGGGIIFANVVTWSLTGTTAANGSTGGAATGGQNNGGGGGGGGCVLIKVQTATLGTGLITATGGVGGSGSNGTGGQGGNGRVALVYLTSYTGTTSPTLNATQDNTLVTTATYQARLGISQNGTTSEYLTKNLSSLSTAQWNRLSITWAAASSLATFYINGAALGTTVGTKTAIHDNASLLYVGANKGASAIQNYMNGYIDDVRIWGAVQTAANIALYTNHQLTGNEGNLKAYYKLNNATTDSGPNANNLTLRNAPAYTTTVPFVDPSARLDLDQSYTTTGSTYAVPTAISEATADQLPFTPANDPQKSIDINIAGKGTGNWTVTIHDQTNRAIASQTITNANMASSGYQEFTWSTAWRNVIGKSYHAHITSSANDGTIVTSSLNVLQSGGSAVADFHTYFQFLVTDTFSHPLMRWLNFIAIGNERYIAKWDGAFYTPNLIAFPPGTHIRCMGVWGKYLAIGTWQEATSGTPNIYDFATGKIYFWDGISLTFNFAIDVPEGQVNAIFGMDAELYYFAGWKGDLLYYQGGFENQSGEFNGNKVKRIPYLERSKYMEMYPQSMTTWQGLLYFGAAGNTNSTALPQGIYSWGALYPGNDKTLSFDHIISTGNNGSSVKIGMIYPVGQKLLASWKDGIAYGVDVVDPTGSVYYTSGLIQTNIQDGGMIYANDLLLKARADHLALNTGEGVTVGFKADRASTFNTINSISDSASKRFTTNALDNGRLSEYQLQATLTGPGTSTPTLLSLAALVDGLDSEKEQF